MPRNPKRYRSPAELLCPVEACGKNCRTQSGLTRHLHAKHKHYQLGTLQSAPAVHILESELSESSLDGIPSQADSDPPATWDDHDFEIPRLFLSSPRRPDSPSRASGRSISIEYHPLINGE